MVVIEYIVKEFYIFSSSLTMKKWYIIAIILVSAALVTTLNYKIDVPPIQTGKIITTREYKWALSGESFITTYNDRDDAIS